LVLSKGKLLMSTPMEGTTSASMGT